VAHVLDAAPSRRGKKAIGGGVGAQEGNGARSTSKDTRMVPYANKIWGRFVSRGWPEDRTFEGGIFWTLRANGRRRKPGNFEEPSVPVGPSRKCH